MLTVPPVTPYTSAGDYLSLLPSYRFSGRSDVELVSDIIKQSAPRARIVADCGAGPCRLGPVLSPTVTKIIAIEPNTLLWRRGISRCHYVAQDALDFLVTTSEPLDVITWMWSLNYVLLSFFESYDPTSRTVTIKNWERGNCDAIRALRQVFLQQRPAVHIIVYFDDASAEQVFLTSVLTRIGPYPFHNRAHTRKLLESVLHTLRQEDAFQFSKQHIPGVALYGSPREAIEKMMRFHLRGCFSCDREVCAAVQGFVNKHVNNNCVSVPAGAYIYVISTYDLS